MSFSEDAQHLLIAGGDNVLRIWRIRPGNSISKSAVGTAGSSRFEFEQVGELTGHSAEISRVSLSHGGDLILTGGVDGISRIWRTSTYEIKTSKLEQAGDDDLQDVAFSPSDDRLVATASRNAYLWNLITGTQVELVSNSRKTGSKRDFWVRHPVFSTDGKRILVQVEHDDNDSKFVELYDSDGNFLMTFPGELNEARSASFSRDNNHLALINEDAAVVWSIKEKRIVKKFGDTSARVVSVAFNPKGTSVATCTRDGLVQLWSFPQWKPLTKMRMESDELYQLGFSPNGNYVYVRDAYRRQWLWNPLTHRVIEFAKRDQTVMEWRFSDDSSLVFSHDLTDRTLVEQTKDGKTVSSLPSEILAIGLNNKFLIDSKLAFWETFRSRLFAKTIVPSDFSPIGVKLKRGELIAVSKDG
ncbi:MAG TPA: hypothetical protein VN843_03440, partial [Anaerolineales bacterium]|nr:hypothetical protein [Anaerolineales bacterium]